MDITFNIDDEIFNYRVCAIIFNGDKILALKDETSPYYYLPGGRVKINETTEKALIREMKEELGVLVKIIRPLWISQSFFKEDRSGKKYHELCFYYLVKFGDDCHFYGEDKFVLNEDGQQLSFEWLEKDSLANKYIYPTFIKKEILSLPSELRIIEEYE